MTKRLGWFFLYHLPSLPSSFCPTTKLLAGTRTCRLVTRSRVPRTPAISSRASHQTRARCFWRCTRSGPSAPSWLRTPNVWGVCPTSTSPACPSAAAPTCTARSLSTRKWFGRPWRKAIGGARTGSVSSRTSWHLSLILYYTVTFLGVGDTLLDMPNLLDMRTDR